MALLLPHASEDTWAIWKSGHLSKSHFLPDFSNTINKSELTVQLRWPGLGWDGQGALPKASGRDGAWAEAHSTRSTRTQVAGCLIQLGLIPGFASSQVALGQPAWAPHRWYGRDTSRLVLLSRRIRCSVSALEGRGCYGGTSLLSVQFLPDAG